VTADEDQAEQVISDGVVEAGIEVRHGLFSCGEVACQLFVFTLGDGVAAEQIDGAAFGGGGEPCRGIIGDTRLRPLFQGGDQCFLRQVFDEADVAGEAGQAPSRRDLSVIQPAHPAANPASSTPANFTGIIRKLQ
jgi:hypothetical protein